MIKINQTELIIYIVIGIWSVMILAFLTWGVYATWFDKRLRVFIIDSKSMLTFHKVKTKNDITFTVKEHTYAIDKEAIYRRNTKIPYAIYYENVPNPLKITKPSGKDPIGKYTSQELHRLLEVNYTLNLIKPNMSIKRIAMTTGILVGIGIVAMLILHFTGVVDIQTLLLQPSATS